MKCNGRGRTRVDYHEPIEHEEFYCPLCCALEDGMQLQDALDVEAGKLMDSESKIEDLQLLDVQELQAQLEEANMRVYQAETKYKALAYAIQCGRASEPKHKRWDRIVAAWDRMHAGITEGV